MEAIKPLVVLVLFGTILYGAYSVVQRGPTTDPAAAATAGDAPPFAAAPTAPQVELAPAAPAAPVTPPAPATSPENATAQAVSQPLPPSEGQAHALAAPVTLAPSAVPPAAVPAPAVPAASSSAATPAVAAGSTLLDSAAAPVAAAAAAAAAPTYLNAVAAPPPLPDQPPPQPLADQPGPTSPAAAVARPDRYATLAPPPIAAPSDPAPPEARPGAASSAAFAAAWEDAHGKLSAGRYAEALGALSVWYDDPSLGLEESQRLEDLLGQLAGTVIYSQQDLLLPPHVVAAGETLPAIATSLGVSGQLLAKINGVPDPNQLIPGEHLKVIRGPFDAVVSISRRRLSLQLNGNFAGSFPVVVGRQFLTRVGGSLAVTDVQRGGESDVTPAATGTTPNRRMITLADGMTLEAVDDPTAASDNAPPASLVVSVRDLAELVDILGPGSRVLIRQ